MGCFERGRRHIPVYQSAGGHIYVSTFYMDVSGTSSLSSLPNESIFRTTSPKIFSKNSIGQPITYLVVDRTYADIAYYNTCRIAILLMLSRRIITDQDILTASAQINCVEDQAKGRRKPISLFYSSHHHKGACSISSVIRTVT